MPAPMPSRAASAPTLLPPVTVRATPAITTSASSSRVTVSASFSSTRASTATSTGAVYSKAAAPATPTPAIANWYAISNSATRKPPPTPTSSQPRPGPRLPAQGDATAREPHPDHAAAGRRLIRRHLGAPQALAPERRQRAVGGSRHGVFVHAGAGREEARHEIVAGGSRPAGDDDAARLCPCQCGEVGGERAHRCLGVDLEQVVELASPHPARGYAERFRESRWQRGRGRGCGGGNETPSAPPPRRRARSHARPGSGPAGPPPRRGVP